MEHYNKLELSELIKATVSAFWETVKNSDKHWRENVSTSLYNIEQTAKETIRVQTEHALRIRLLEESKVQVTSQLAEISGKLSVMALNEAERYGNSNRKQLWNNAILVLAASACSGLLVKLFG